jgi:uncharacterized protein YneF (UPF0154 family)
MTGVEITLIVIGIVFVIGSFGIQEKLSQKDMEEITRMSEKELHMIVNKQLKNADAKVEDSIDRIVEEMQNTTRRQMEKESNEKIMAISEYSDTVIESMNKTHDEILFLYSMLNDKHSELTGLASSLQQLADNMKDTENEVLQNLADATKELEQKTSVVETFEEQPLPEAAMMQVNPQNEEEDGVNHNEKILILHKQGVSDVAIARELGLGLGEVKLVIGLFKGEEAGEA